MEPSRRGFKNKREMSHMGCVFGLVWRKKKFHSQRTDLNRRPFISPLSYVTPASTRTVRADYMAQWQRVGFQTRRLGVRFPLWSVCFCKSNTAKLPRENGMSLPEGTLLRSRLASLPDTVEYQARAVEAPVISDCSAPLTTASGRSS